MKNNRNLKPWQKRALCLFSILVIGLAAFLPFSVPATAASAGWIMCYFTENPNNYDLHLAYSTDALHWTALNNGAAVVHPTSGKQGLRDPFILKKQDGTFVVMATDMNGTDFVNGTSPYIHIWDSADLCTFSNYRWVRMTSTNMHAWAPEAFYDSSRGQYAILWSGNSNYNKIYANYTTDFRNVGAEQIYFDPGFSVLDADVITGSTNYLYYKRESDNRLYGSKSTSLNPGSFNSGTYTSGLLQGNAIEAPELIPNGSTWYLYGDSYSPTNGVLYAWQTTNIGGNSWSALGRSSYQQPPAAKHPGIVAVTADQMTNILARWGGGPTPTRRPNTPTPTRRISTTPTPTQRGATPTQGGSLTYQSENASYGGGTVTETTNGGYNGTGYVNFPSTGGYVQFNNVNGGTGGTKMLKFRNALGVTSSRTGRIQVNGGTWQNITFSPTGSWTTWTVFPVSATLNSGTGNTIRLESTGQDLANIDELGI